MIILDSRGPFFYAQTQTGLHNTIFKVYMFQPMVVEAEKERALWAEVYSPRVTLVVNFILKSRINELTQLWDVLKAE